MKLTKSDALFVYRALYDLDESFIRGDSDQERLVSLTSRLFDFLTGEQTEESIDDDDDIDYEESDVSDDDDETEEDVATITPQSLVELESAIFLTPDGSKSLLEFDLSDEGTMDALIDDGDVVIEGITHLRVSLETVSLFDGEEWHDFRVFKKLPKSWLDVLKPGDYQIGEE